MSRSDYVHLCELCLYLVSGAQGDLFNLDFRGNMIESSVSQEGTIQIGWYVFLGVMVLFAVNIICFTIFVGIDVNHHQMTKDIKWLNMIQK